jgi:hypothetical protein
MPDSLAAGISLPVSGDLTPLRPGHDQTRFPGCRVWSRQAARAHQARSFQRRIAGPCRGSGSTCAGNPCTTRSTGRGRRLRRSASQTASNRDPGSASKRDRARAFGQACPGSEQEGPARVAQCPHERRSGARGRCLFAHRGKPGWHSGAVFETPALVAGFDNFAMMGQAVEERGGAVHRTLGRASLARRFCVFGLQRAGGLAAEGSTASLRVRHPATGGSR